MTLALEEIIDLDCVLSWRPLVLGLPATETYAHGGDAIARRVLVSWARKGGLYELSGRSFTQGELALVRSRFGRLAEEEDYVVAARVTLTLEDASILAVGATLTLEDGATYPLEVSTADAATALLALGSSTA